LAFVGGTEIATFVFARLERTHKPARKEHVVTTLMKRDPFLTVAPLDRVLNQFFSRDPFFTRFDEMEEETLPLDISETEKEVLVRASLPGFEKDDVHIEVNETVLTIRATHTDEKEESGETFSKRERRIGSLFRRVELPTAVDEGQAWAELVNGELTLRLHKADKDTPRRISIS
jgi:HSP20 family protein